MALFQEYFYAEIAVWQLGIHWAFEGGIRFINNLNCFCHLENSSPYTRRFLKVFTFLNLVMTLGAILPSNDFPNIYKDVSRPDSHLSLPTHLCFYIRTPTSFSYACLLLLSAFEKLFRSILTWELFKKRIWHSHGD